MFLGTLSQVNFSLGDFVMVDFVAGGFCHGGHSEQLLFFALFDQRTPSCLKVGGGVVAHVILESAQGPNPSFFLYI